MSSTLLVESTAVPQATGTAGRWKATLITPGQGSSGFYSESMLKEFGPIALRKGAKSFVTHNRMENGEPDPFQMWGFLAEDSYYEDGVGLVGEIEVLPSWRARVEEVAPHTALSIYVMGEADSEGNISQLIEDSQNGVDMVVHAGRPGSSLVEKMYETAVSTKRASEQSGDGTKEKNMTEKLEEKLDALTLLISTFISESKIAAEKQAQESAAALAAVKDADTKVAESIAAIESIPADLPDALRESLISKVKSGHTDIAPEIVAAKALFESIKGQVQVQTPGYRFTESAGSTEDYRVGGFVL